MWFIWQFSIDEFLTWKVVKTIRQLELVLYSHRHHRRRHFFFLSILIVSSVGYWYEKMLLCVLMWQKVKLIESVPSEWCKKLGNKQSVRARARAKNEKVETIVQSVKFNRVKPN